MVKFLSDVFKGRNRVAKQILFLKGTFSGNSKFFVSANYKGVKNTNNLKRTTKSNSKMPS